ncbi:MAG: hypothetical protein ACLFR1_10770 [Spirochaetia bacterium]
MKEKLLKYLQILSIELEDIEQDIYDLLELTSEREKRKEITHYVSLENIAVLKEEISELERMLGSLEKVDTTQYSSLDELINDIDKRLREGTVDSGFPPAVYSMVKRKLYKIKDYICSE